MGAGWGEEGGRGRGAHPPALSLLAKAAWVPKPRGALAIRPCSPHPPTMRSQQHSSPLCSQDLDERMHTTPYFHATNLPNVRPQNLVQIGIGGWQVRHGRRGVCV
jgi:hypothetical protein